MRLIDADALLPMMRYTTIDSEIGIFPIKIGFKEIVRVIDDAPTVEAEPVRHGKWKQWDSYGFEDTYECTACGEPFVLIEGTPITNGYKYCPSCGAKMDGEEE